MALERTTIIAAALDLMDEAGLDGLTMRRLADALNVQAPSLYWHFASKPALLDAMANALLEDVASTPDGSADFRTILRRSADELRAALQSRRDGARVYASTSVMGENVLRLMQTMMEALDVGGFDPETSTRASVSLLHYVLGFAIEEEAWRGRRSADPTVEAGLRHFIAGDENARFDFGVDLILTGLSGHRSSEASQMDAFIRAFKATR